MSTQTRLAFLSWLPARESKPPRLLLVWAKFRLAAWAKLANAKAGPISAWRMVDISAEDDVAAVLPKVGAGGWP